MLSFQARTVLLCERRDLTPIQKQAEFFCGSQSPFKSQLLKLNSEGIVKFAVPRG